MLCLYVILTFKQIIAIASFTAVLKYKYINTCLFKTLIADGAKSIKLSLLRRKYLYVVTQMSHKVTFIIHETFSEGVSYKIFLIFFGLSSKILKNNLKLMNIKVVIFIYK